MLAGKPTFGSLEPAYHTFIKKDMRFAGRERHIKEALFERLQLSKQGTKPEIDSVKVESIDMQPVHIPLEEALFEMFTSCPSLPSRSKASHLLRSHPGRLFLVDLFWLVFLVIFQDDSKPLQAQYRQRMSRAYILHVVTADLGLLSDKLSLVFSETVCFMFEHTFGSAVDIACIYQTVHSEICGTPLSHSTIQIFRSTYFQARPSLPASAQDAMGGLRATNCTGSAVRTLLGVTKFVTTKDRGIPLKWKVRSEVIPKPSLPQADPAPVETAVRTEMVSDYDRLMKEHGRLLKERPRRVVASSM